MSRKEPSIHKSAIGMLLDAFLACTPSQDGRGGRHVLLDTVLTHRSDE
jgi:hypothetical protein